MARLGDFGAAQKELSGEQDDFGFFGEDFTVVGSIPAMLMLQLGAAATGKIDDTEGYAAMWEALRCSLTVPAHQQTTTAGDDREGGWEEVPEDDSEFRRIYRLAVDKKCDIDPLMDLVFKLFEVQAGAPTRQESDSSPGRSPTSQSSSGSSTPAVRSHLRSVDDIVRNGGDLLTQEPGGTGTIRMGDGQIVEVNYDTPPPAPAEQTG